MNIHHPENKRKVPSALRCLDGTEVRTAEEWRRKRCPEILKMFREEEYGLLPDLKNMKVEIRLVDSRRNQTFMEGQAIRQPVESLTALSTLHHRCKATSILKQNSLLTTS